MRVKEKERFGTPTDPTETYSFLVYQKVIAGRCQRECCRPVLLSICSKSHVSRLVDNILMNDVLLLIFAAH